MVIICPRCEARYRLDDGRMKGRGARVVCPRCQHVFVVLRSQAALAGDEGEAAPLPEAVGVISRATPGPIRVVSPGPRKQRKEVATIEVEAIDPGQDVEPEELVASELDFRAVGIRAWKVRAQIGITYDFSDLATLKRYLANGRVGPDDELSCDGAGWVRLGDIDDLDAFFVTAWRRARAVLPADPAPAASGSAPAEPPRQQSQPPRPVATPSRLTPVTERRDRVQPVIAPRRRRAPDRRLLWGVAAVVLVAGWVLALNHTRPPPVEPPDEPGVDADTGPGAGLAEDVASDPDEAGSEDVPEATPETTPEPVVAVPNPRPGRLAPPSQRRDTPAPTPSPAFEGEAVAGENWYRGGARSMEEADFGKARDMFARAVKKAPGEPRYWEALGDAQVRLGDTEGAARSFSRAEELGHANVGR